MQRGILYLAYDARPLDKRAVPLASDFIVEMRHSVESARRLKLPIALLLEEGANLDLDLKLFDQVVPFDNRPYQSDRVHEFVRKYLLFDKTPFDLTLYLDSDAFIVNETHPVNPVYPPQPPPHLDSFEYPFAMAERFGLAMAYDGLPLWRLEHDRDGAVILPYEIFHRAVFTYLPGVKYVPLFNGGVMFYRRGFPGLADLVSLARNISLSLTVDDQTGLSVAAVLRKFVIYPLYDRTWNLRNHSGPYLEWWGASIIHSPSWFSEWLRWKEQRGNT